MSASKKPDDFAQEIRRVRAVRHLSITQLSECTHIRETDLIKYETGEKIPDMNALLKLKDALRIRIKFSTLKSDSI